MTYLGSVLSENNRWNPQRYASAHGEGLEGVDWK
jgi:hypothetical protein